MEKPKCRICGVRHWSNEPHVFSGEPEVRQERKVVERPKRDSACSECGATAATFEDAAKWVRERDRRRRYMRKRRE